MTSKLVLVAAAAAAIALALLAFMTDAAAYAGSEPSTCANCHTMADQYENWFHGGHHATALCTDCHLPHHDLITYYAEKGRQGAKDTWAFIAAPPQPQIRASEKTRALIQGNCVRCHEGVVADIMAGTQPFDRRCWECHRSTAHGARGITASPYQDRMLYPAH